MSKAPTPPVELRERVLAAARAQPVPSRQVWQRRNAVALVAGAGVSLAALAAIGGPSMDGRPTGYFVAVVALWVAVGALATWASVSRGRSMLGRSAAWRTAVAVLTPVLLVATAALAGIACPSFFRGESDLHHHLICIVCTIAMAAGPLAAFVLMRRGSDPVAPRLTGAALGAAAGAWGATCIELRCGLATVDHIVLGHVLPVAMLAVLGMVVGARWVAVRTSA